MDAVKFVDAYIRMCSQGWDCEDCPLSQSDDVDFCSSPPKKRSRESAEKVVQIVEQWAKEHPVKTRQSEFLNLFPDASLLTGNVNVCPNSLYEGKCDCAQYPNCFSCKREFWSQEVE